MYSGISQSSVSRAISEVTETLNIPNVFNQWVRFPDNIQELNAIS